jgi:hypothetical protein
MIAAALAASLGAALFAACVLPAARFEGYACDGTHACASGYACADGVCVTACSTASDCTEGLTCNAGACREGPAQDAGPRDGGPDEDAGPDVDAGPDQDAGQGVDAGPSDLCFSDPPFCAAADLVVTVCPQAPCPPGRTAASLQGAVNMLVDGEVVVFVPGELSIGEVTVDEGSVTIVGEDGTRLNDLTVEGAAQARLVRVTTYDPIRLYETATLTIEDSRVGFEQNCLVAQSGTTLVVRRSAFFACQKGAIITTGAATIENSFFTANGQIGGGANGSSLGGVRMDGPAEGNVFRFNTLAGNRANTAPAADCGDSATRLEHSIFFNNDGENGSTPDVLGCKIVGSLVDFTAPPDAGNLEGDPELLDGGFHIAPTSPALDQAIGGTLGDDIDGEVRPQGAARDLGADEAG